MTLIYLSSSNSVLMLVMTHISTQSLEGLFFDELSKVRVIDPETNGQTQELKEDCKEFVDSEWHACIIIYSVTCIHVYKGFISHQSPIYIYSYMGS